MALEEACIFHLASLRASLAALDMAQSRGGQPHGTLTKLKTCK